MNTCESMQIVQIFMNSNKFILTNPCESSQILTNSCASPLIWMNHRAVYAEFKYSWIDLTGGLSQKN